MIDDLPLTPHGKIDRSRLPAPQSSGISTTYVAPETPEDALLCQLVAGLLGVQRVGLADHFFHLGGDSLTAMRLSAQVRVRLGRDLRVQTIFESPVLRDLAARTGLVTDHSAAFELLLPIRTARSEPPLFCLHPGTGLCWSYTNLLHAIGAEQPVYGIQARGFTSDRSIARTLDEIAADSLAAIRRVRPHGPYRLLGWSFGGIVAHMVACRLQATGESVERLILLDSYPPPPDMPIPEAGGFISDQTWREVARGTDLTLPAEGECPPLDATQIATLARQQIHILGTFPLEQLEQLAIVMGNNSRLFPTAQLGQYDGDIDLFVATRQTPGLEHIAATPEAWRPFCTGELRVTPVDAEHHRMVSPAALRQIGRLPLCGEDSDLAAAGVSRSGSDDTA